MLHKGEAELYYWRSRAGLEIDLLLIVSDTSRRGLQAAARINKLARELNIGVENSQLVINRIQEPPSEMMLEIIRQGDLTLAGTVPSDESVYNYDLEGRPTIEMPEDTPALSAAFDIFDKIIE